MEKKSGTEREDGNRGSRQQDMTRPRQFRRIVMLATTAAVVVGIVIAVSTNKSTKQQNASDPPTGIVSSTLASAAAAVSFHPTLRGNDGKIENLPASAARPPAGRHLLPVGSKAPTFTLKTVTGRKVSLADYRGKTVLLEFFATWCPHCQAETPHLVDLARKLGPSGYALLSVNADSENAASVYAFDHYFHVPYPTLLDPGSRPGSYHHRGGLGPLGAAYKISYFPTFYIIDRSGRIAWRSDREQPDALLLKMMKDAAGA